jgi:hypothetical protein
MVIGPQHRHSAHHRRPRHAISDEAPDQNQIFPFASSPLGPRSSPAQSPAAGAAAAGTETTGCRSCRRINSSNSSDGTTTSDAMRKSLL